MTTPKRRGPKPKPPAEVRTTEIRARVTTAEREQVEAAAVADGVTVSELVRRAVGLGG